MRDPIRGTLASGIGDLNVRKEQTAEVDCQKQHKNQDWRKDRELHDGLSARRGRASGDELRGRAAGMLWGAGTQMIQCSSRMADFSLATLRPTLQTIRSDAHGDASLQRGDYDRGQ